MTYKTPVFVRRLPELITEYLEAHPRTASRDLAQALGAAQGAINVILFRMRRAGEIHSVHDFPDRRSLWVVGPDPDWDPDAEDSGLSHGRPRQRIVKSWEPPKVANDPLLWSMFGGRP